MINIIDKNKCCGCYACKNICPKNCIQMVSDYEGFWYPKVNIKKCVDCGLCEKVCPHIQSLESSKFRQTYAAKNKNENIRENSSSGGLFSILAEYVINKNGVVFGAKFNEKFEVIHSYATTISGYKQFMGSKYVQSKIGDTYKKAKLFLDKGMLVMFSGTQCQIKGLNLYLNKNYDNLITIDIICHGVASPKVFSKYINEKRLRYNERIQKIEFRNKELGWDKFSFKIEFLNGKIYKKIFNKDLYMKGFLENLYLRPSCYKCESKNFSSNSDFSLADYWGIKDIHTDFYDEKGVSLIICNNEKAKEILNNISPRLDLLQTNIKEAIRYNSCIVSSVNYNYKREQFFENIDKRAISKNIKKYTTITKCQKIKNKIKNKMKILCN